MKPTPTHPKRILMTVDPVSGVWNYAMELTQALTLQNVQVGLAILGGNLSREQRREVKQLTGVEVFESNFKLEWMDGGCDDMDRASSWLLEIEKRTSPDVIHLNSYAHGALPFLAPKVIAAHSCAAARWKTANGEAASENLPRYLASVNQGLHAADLVIAPTRATLVQLETKYGKLSGKVIFHGRDPAKFLPARKEEFIFVTGQLWDETKNIAALAAIASELPWSIYAAGEGRPPNGSTPKFKTLQLLGKLPPDVLAKWYGRASIYAFPARYEPSGLCILEAALAGCALVLGDIPSLREIWNGVAVFVPPNNPDELKSALGQMILNPIRRKEFASYAQCRAIQLTPHTMAAQYLAAYSEVMAKQSAKPGVPAPPQTLRQSLEDEPPGEEKPQRHGKQASAIYI